MGLMLWDPEKDDFESWLFFDEDEDDKGWGFLPPLRDGFIFEIIIINYRDWNWE